MHFPLLLDCFFVAFSLAAPADPAPSATSTAPAAQSTACGDIAKSCNVTFTAKQAYDCLVSVPFNPAVATSFIRYYNDTLQFQSTLAYLKDPPASYQQPAIDLIGGLRQIQRDVDNGVFQNQYAFEATLQKLIYAAHDAHLQLVSGVLAAFTFASPYGLISLSTNGTQIPKIYIMEDVQLKSHNADFTLSAVTSINGQDVTDYLSHLAAANSIGNLEPDADWSDLMSSWAASIQGDYSIIEAYITFYPGDTITFAFENNTQLGPLPWHAIYNSPGPTGPLATGGDFYNFFVLGFYPASYDSSTPDPCPAAATSTDSSVSAPDSTSFDATASPTSWADTAYPSTADIYQPNLYPIGGGFVTGYYLRNISTAVLSIPTFQMQDGDIQSFSDTIGNFLNGSHSNGMTKIVIDLQQNLGGQTLLAVDAFKHFFPSNESFRGSRLRAHPTADVLGNTFTTYYAANQSPNSTVYDALSASDWVATDRLNADAGQNFTSWGDFYGPLLYNGDYFTNTERENIYSSIFDSVALGINVYGASRPATLPQLYDPENIIILTDGLCSSACAFFVEAMHYDAGVRTVVVGGRPRTGPMQTASGSRGAQFYDSYNIDVDIAVAEAFNATTTNYLPDRHEDVMITYAGINLRDQIRKGSTIPLQFLYDAANCRIFFTQTTWLDYTALWTYAANAIWKDPSMCIPGSTGFASTTDSMTTQPPPQRPDAPTNTSTSLPDAANNFTAGFSGQEIDRACVVEDQNCLQGALGTQVSATGSACPCKGPLKCQLIQPCGGKRCVSACDNHGNGCAVGRCNFTTRHPKGNFRGHVIEFWSGYCPFTCATSSQTFLGTKPNEPAEHSDGGEREAGLGSYINEPFGGHRGIL